MTSTLLLNELTNLSSEAKRKNAELRNAAERSLQELKGLPATSEQQLAAGRILFVRLRVLQELTCKRSKEPTSFH